VPNCKILLLLLSKVSDKNNKTIGLLIAKLAQLSFDPLGKIYATWKTIINI